MAEEGPGKGGVYWHKDCIEAVDGITAPWSLVHLPSLAARLVHALVRVLATGGCVLPSSDGRRSNGGSGGSGAAGSAGGAGVANGDSGAGGGGGGRPFGIFGSGGACTPREDNRRRDDEARDALRSRMREKQREEYVHNVALEVGSVSFVCMCTRAPLCQPY